MARSKRGKFGDIAKPAGEKAFAPDGRAGRAGLLLRALAALCIVAASLWLIRFNWMRVWADTASQKGFAESLNDKLLLVGLADLRTALRLAPEDPVTQYRVANVIVRIESQHLAAETSGYQSVNVKEITDARELMIRARDGRSRPQDVALRLAHTEVLMTEYFRRAGDMARMRELSGYAANHFAEFREMQGRPNFTPYEHYCVAMEHSMTEPFPQLALTQYDDFVFFFGEYSFPANPPPGEETEESRKLDRTHDKIDRLAGDARYLLGEFPLMMHQSANLVFRHPGDPAVLRGFVERGANTGQTEFAIRLLRALQKDGKATPESESVLGQLEAQLPAASESRL